MGSGGNLFLPKKRVPPDCCGHYCVFFKKDGLFTAWFHVTADQESYDERTENVRDYVAYAYNLLCDAALQCVRYANTEGWHYYAGPQPPYTTDPEEIPCP